MHCPVIGLTGGIASGKSTVSAILREQAIPIIDADTVARDVEAAGSPCLTEIINEFGSEYLLTSGELDRRLLGKLVFSDSAALKKLNHIVKPFLLKALSFEIAKQQTIYTSVLKETGKKPFAMIILDCALLTEDVQYRKLADRIWVVHADENVRKHRLMLRNHLSETDAIQRIKSQATEEERLQIADFVIDNNGDMEITRKQLLAQIKQFSESP